jgi:hypothetical protein
MTVQTPTATAARFPAEYGQTPETTAELRAWDEVAERIAASPNYLLATTTDDGRPHLRPVDGVFVDGTLCFGGSPETGWVRQLQRRSGASVILPDADQAVILEGEVELVDDADLPLAGAVLQANIAKYPQYFASESPTPSVPFWAFRSRRIYAWSLTEFPRRATRFDFDDRTAGGVSAGANPPSAGA